MIALAGVLLALGMGVLATDLALGRTPLALRLSLGLGAGLGLTSLWTYVAWLLGGRSLALLLTVELVVVFVVLSFGPRRAAPEERARAPRALAVAFGLGLASFAGIFVALTLFQIDGFWDAWTIWNYHARVLVRADAGALATGIAFHCDDYPLLLPASVARLWTFGGESKLAPVLVAAGFALATTGVLVEAVRERRGPALGLAAGLALLSAERFIEYAPAQIADVPVAFYRLAGLVLLGRGLDGSRRALALAGAMAGFAAWTKNEGALDVMALGLATLVATRSLRSLGWFLAGAALPLACVLHWKLALAPKNGLIAGQGHETLARLASPGRWAKIARAVATEVGVHTPFPLVALVLGLAGSRAFPERPLARAASVALALYGVAYLAVYATTPHDLDWHLETSLDRVLLQTTPAALFVCALGIPSRESAVTRP